MTKEEFIKTLESTEEVSKDSKVEVLQYFINNYPVLIDQVINTPVGNFKTGQKYWTALQGIDLNVVKPRNVDANFKQLVARLEEIKQVK